MREINVTCKSIHPDTEENLLSYIALYITNYFSFFDRLPNINSKFNNNYGLTFTIHDIIFNGSDDYGSSYNITVFLSEVNFTRP